MDEKGRLIDLNLLLDRGTVELFEKAATANNTTAKDILTDFMKDYIVSNGHPELVVNRWPWNKQE